MGFIPIPLFQTLESVFQFLPTKYLISTCRLVSKEWNSSVSSICRHRRLHFRFPSQESLEKFRKTFQNSQTLPWSSYSFIRSGIAVFMDYTRDIPIILKFISMFGQLVTQVEVEGYNFQFLLDLLQWTPNIESILFKGLEEKKEKVDINFHPPATDNFSHLKSFLHFEINGSTSFQVFDFITTRSPLLNEISLTVGSQGAKYTTQISTLIDRIPSISLRIQELPPAAYTPFSVHNLRVQELWLAVPSPTDTKEFYAPLEQFLHHVSPYLKKFIINHDRNYKEHVISSYLKIPPLPVLTFLKVEDGAPCPGGGELSPPLLFIKSPFTTKQFPVLEKFHISSLGGTVSQFTSASFPTVRELDVTKPRCATHFLQNDWASIFPNLRKLNCQVNENGLYYIFREMRRLEELTVKINLKVYNPETQNFVLPEESDINSILSGYEDPDTVCKVLKGKAYQTPGEEETPVLSLLQMKGTRGDRIPICRNVEHIFLKAEMTRRVILNVSFRFKSTKNGLAGLRCSTRFWSLCFTTTNAASSKSDSFECGRKFSVCIFFFRNIDVEFTDTWTC